MQRYILYCTEEQTRKALKLGAPIEEFCGFRPAESIDGILYDIPTAEQMLGWLEWQDVYINICWDDSIYYVHIRSVDNGYLGIGNKIFQTRREATIAAIDAALEYLSNKKK